MSAPQDTPTVLAEQQGESDITRDPAAGEEKDLTSGVRKFFGLGKKKEEKQAPMESATAATPAATNTSSSSSTGKRPAELKPSAQPIPISSPRSPGQSSLAASPGRLRSTSPRVLSPASSEIFERNVQEPANVSQLQGELSPAHIPSHMITEDYIPPALEASAQAITSDSLNADEVEIVTSASHQPAASALEGSASHADLTQLNAPFSPLSHVRSEDSEAASSMHQSGFLPTGEEDGASSYGQLDPTDVRRLSFISFADVVQSEHQAPPGSSISEAGDRSSLHMSSLPGGLSVDRGASPLRSPRSPVASQSGLITPPAGGPTSSANPEHSPGRSVLSTPMSAHSELTIETMRQAVRKTASGDLSGIRSAQLSPVNDEAMSSLSVGPQSRTNS